MNCRAIVSRPSHNTVKFLIKCVRRIYQGIDVAGFITRSGMNQEMERAIVIGNNRIQKVVPAAQISESAFAGPQGISNHVPSGQIQVFRGHG
jgi:hypothetical protein